MFVAKDVAAQQIDFAFDQLIDIQVRGSMKQSDQRDTPARCHIGDQLLKDHWRAGCFDAPVRFATVTGLADLLSIKGHRLHPTTSRNRSARASLRSTSSTGCSPSSRNNNAASPPMVPPPAISTGSPGAAANRLTTRRATPSGSARAAISSDTPVGTFSRR